MAKKVLSIVIGTESTKVCEVSYKKNYKNKGIRVYRSISFPTPPNSIEDGYIKDKDVFGEELRSQLKANKLKSDKVIFSISSSKIANREIILPPMKEKKIMDIIKTGASDYFPIDIKDYILSYYILEKNSTDRKEKSLRKQLDKKELKLAIQLEKQNRKALKKKSKTEIIADQMEIMETKNLQLQPSIDNENIEEMNSGKKHMRLSVYAVPSTLVKNYYNFAKSMHFDIVSLDYSGNSIYQMIKRQVNRGTNVFIQINEQDTLISILRDDVLILQRTVGYGITTLTDAVMEQEYYQVKSKEEAIELLEKKNLLTLELEKQGLQFDSSWTKGEAAAASEFVNSVDTTKVLSEEMEYQARSYILDSFHSLTNSIARMIDYYRSNHKNIKVNTIYISGIGTHIQGISEFFSSEIDITNKKIEKLWTVSANKKATVYRKNPGEFLPCIGAVLKPIDFVPNEFIVKKQIRSAIVATVIFALACLAGSAGTIYVSYTDYMVAKQELDNVKNELNVMGQSSSTQIEYEEAIKKLENLQQFDAMTASNNDEINSVIEALEKNLPKGTVINTMQFSETGVSMSVTASDNATGANALVAKLLIQFKTIEYFETVDVSGISVEEDDVMSRIAFSITCSYKK
jgi:type IV pilus assembly protein PilM